MRKFSVLFSVVLLFAATSVLRAQSNVIEDSRASDINIVGNLYPLGVSLTHIGTETYTLEGIESLQVDSIVWKLDPDVWPITLKSDGKKCQVNVLTFEDSIVLLKVTVVLKDGNKIEGAIPLKCVYYGVSEEEVVSGVEIAPNPTSGNVVLHLDNMQGSVGVTVFDARGAQVDAFGLNCICSREEVAYSLSGRPSGMYVFVIRGANAVTTRKVLVN